ncbi:hypothetical protein TNCV_5136101 [Trichonephila clavipes]|nr:hypothetical protein TNCV_5136101 [Trichonephila clavipes]
MQLQSIVKLYSKKGNSIVIHWGKRGGRETETQKEISNCQEKVLNLKSRTSTTPPRQSASRTASGEEKTAFRENDDTPSPPRSSSFPPKRTEARHRRIPSRKTEPPENVLDGSVTQQKITTRRAHPETETNFRTRASRTMTSLTL